MSETNEKKIVYYPGCTVEFWDPEIGKAVVHILEKNGFQVIVPEHQCCGVAQIAYGNFSSALKESAMLVDILFAAAEPDYDIVTACPSCSLAIKEDYPLLLNSEKAKSVAERTYFFSRYLIKLYEKGELNTDFNQLSLSVAYHAPCHLRAQGLDGESVKLMSLIPGVQVTDLDRGCCGMAGTAGFKRRYYDTSMSIGSELFQRVKEVNAQVVATDCAGCKMQIEQGADVEVTHPLILLDKAYA